MICIKLSFPGEGEVPVAGIVPAVFPEEFGALDGGVEPFGFGFYLIVQHGEAPYFPALQPNEFVGIVDVSVPVETGQEPAPLPVDGVFHPERNNVLQKAVPVLRDIGCLHNKLSFPSCIKKAD